MEVGFLTSCYHRQKHEFPSLSGHFTGEYKAICPPIEAQQMFSDAMRQRRTGVNQQQNGFDISKHALCRCPVRALTSTWLRCFGMTSKERFTSDTPRILLKRKGFIKRNGAKFCNYRGYCCQGRVNYLLRF